MKKYQTGGIKKPKSKPVSSKPVMEEPYGKTRPTGFKPKYKSGGNLGMKSVKAGFDKNPGITRADVIVAAKGKAKGGTALKKQAAIAIAMKKAGKSPKKAKGGISMTRMANMKKGGKCKYGC